MKPSRHLPLLAIQRTGNLRPGQPPVGVTRSSRPTQLSRCPGADILATYSPDGRFIGFQSTRDSTDPDIFDLFVMRADGSGETVLTSSPANDVDPDWQPLDKDGN